MSQNHLPPKIFWLTLFAIAMAFVEAAVVIYLRAIYYPDGFRFPLKAFVDYKILIEVCREAATIVMLSTVAHIAGRTFLERFAYLMLSFGVWDIFYYIWLKILIEWPASLLDWDILFLIPVPWIGPVIAPVSVSLLMVIFSILIASAIQKGHNFRPSAASYILALLAIALILYSFTYDTGATLHQQMPKPYRYEFLIAGNGLLAAAFIGPILKNVKQKGAM
jgi:hypothetical protein